MPDSILNPEIDEVKAERLKRIAEVTLYHYKAARRRRGVNVDLRKLGKDRGNKY